MLRSGQGSIRLFRFSGIDVFLHWSWFLVAAFEIQSRNHSYSSIAWNVVEYLALFLIVTLHEFGHALACRQVGGSADRIVLWPLGGVAYVDPPPRPGATLWSIAAGPLVNVVLLPVLYAATVMSRSAGMAATSPDVYILLRSVLYIDLGLLVFNGWRTDFAIAALVSHGPRAQPARSHHPRIRRRRGPYWPRSLGA
jgi:Zn-dependent protease